jgi:hypothetical protein
MVYHDSILAITLRVALQALPPESIKPAKYPGRGTPVKILNPYFSFLVYGTSTYKNFKDLKTGRRSLHTDFLCGRAFSTLAERSP